MGYKARGYDKEALVSKTRDYSLFAIACEGTEREPEYFRPFDGIDRIKVDIIKNKIGKRDSAPKKVLERAKEYIEEVGLSEKDGDTLWFILDVDNWPREQLNELNDFCKRYENWHIVISNPCFEIWLLYHKLEDLDKFDCSTASKTKKALHELDKGGYFYLNYLPLLNNAIENARVKDLNPKYYLPNQKETKVYQLGEALLNRIGKPRFEDFVKEYLSTLKPKKGPNRKMKK